MPRIALTNDRWGFASQCFVCEPANATGLQIPFFHDEEAQIVVAQFTLSAAFSGAPNYVHGGISLAILDEAMAWATIAVAGKFAVTKTTTTTFERPIRIGMAHTVEARVTEQGALLLLTEATILDAKNRVCALASAEFVPLDLRQATAAIGEVGDSHSGFVRP